MYFLLMQCVCIVYSACASGVRIDCFLQVCSNGVYLVEYDRLLSTCVYQRCVSIRL